MGRRRFYAPGASSTPEEIFSMGREESRHMRDVLRSRDSDTVYVFDGNGNEIECVIDNVGKGNDPAQLKVIKTVPPASPESPLNLRLAMSLTKGEKFDLVVQKATELGVNEIVPVLTTRSDIRPKDSSDIEKRRERWSRIAIEAAKQCGRARVPRIPELITFNELIKSRAASDHAIFFTEREGKPFEQIRPDLPFSLLAIIGPEGGWDNEEIALAKDSNLWLVTLRGRILRTETAAIVAITLLQNHFGDLN
jgi:16S rRNA (uracil1498-N3)-methyltransferase